MVPAGRIARDWRLYVAAGVAVAAVILCGALAQPKAEQEGSGAKAHNQEAKPYERGTPELPVVVKMAGGPTAQEQAAAHTAEVKQHDADQAWLIRIGVGTIAAGLVQAAVLVWQIIYLKGTLSHTRESSERELRAYVFPMGLSIHNVALSNVPVAQRTGAHLGDPKLGPVVLMTIKNFGQTPAYRAAVTSSIEVRAFDPNAPISHVPNYVGASMNSIAPDNTSEMHLRLPRVLTKAEVLGLNAGTMAIYFAGRIDYLDVFGHARWTTFNYYHNSMCGIMGRIQGLNACHHGNDGDRAPDDFVKASKLQAAKARWDARFQKLTGWMKPASVAA
jgi:hypothetical protein